MTSRLSASPDQHSRVVSTRRRFALHTNRHVTLIVALRVKTLKMSASDLNRYAQYVTATSSLVLRAAAFVFLRWVCSDTTSTMSCLRQLKRMMKD